MFINSLIGKNKLSLKRTSSVATAPGCTAKVVTLVPGIIINAVIGSRLKLNLSKTIRYFKVLIKHATMDL